ncbi:hypothetical protein Tsubulata_026113 [Turnera subulata]|uniref:Nucleoside phosphorylase domain-containing protein n=1 Tax=Turnera subulata TaxID=218843 RepID=A0A9Q0F7Q1_9ROSI|nr:hypothetical protein Tsubulata_026113 [Turnera subulata]
MGLPRSSHELGMEDWILDEDFSDPSFPEMVNAAATTQQMLDLFDIKRIVHFGISGNLNNSLSIGDVVIPKQFAHTGLWNWMNLNRTVDPTDVAHLEFRNYNVPQGDGSGSNLQPAWRPLTLQGMELERCVNSSFCLPENPKLVAGLSGSTPNIFMGKAT